MNFKFFLKFILVMVFISLSTLSYAQDYTLDYGILGISGAVCGTTDYSVVDLISDVGMSQETQTGGIYTITTLVGMEDEPAVASCWMLYE